MWKAPGRFLQPMRYILTAKRNRRVEMEWKAAWIWDSGESNPWNYWLCARKVFEAPEGADLDTAMLHITADTRYVLWINGERIGQGPVRAWPALYRYDTYDLGAYLQPDRNVIAVLVHHYGVGTFQSLPTRAGLLAQLEWDGKPQVVTDRSWKVTRNYAFDDLSPRISCQQGWVDNIEACCEPPYDFQDEKAQKEAATGAHRVLPLWYTPGFDDLKWKHAVVIGPAGMAPWTHLHPRDIPLLTQEPVYPVAVLETRRIRTLEQGWFINVRRNLLPGYLDSSPMSICGLLAVRLVNKRDTSVPISIYCPGPGLNVASLLRVNGGDVECVRHAAPPWDNGFSFSFDLPPGENLLLWDLSGHYHEWAVGCVADIPDDVGTGGARDAVYGPFASPEDPDFLAIWDTASFEGLQEFARYKSTRQDWVENPFLSVAYARPLEGKPGIDNVEALCAANEEVATVYPDTEGGTVEILLDFGRMTVGYWEFELFAPTEGHALSLVGFESIQDGVRDFSWGMNNAMSYITREGWQTFRSTVRRGCRYLLLTIHHPLSPDQAAEEKYPVRIRSVRTILNTYPVVERGAFQCSDDRLNAIWKMGQWTTRLCMEDTFVDCPTYEQTFWVGDSRNEGAVNHVAFGEYALTRRCLLLAAESLERSPIVEALVPSAWKANLPCWSFLWALACEEFYQTTGDRAFVQEIYPAMAQQARACLAAIHDNDLFAFDGWQMLDWAPMDVPNDGFITHINAWLVESLRRTARLATLLNHTNDAEDFLKAAERVKRGINAHLWDETRSAYVDCLRRDGTPSSVVSQQTNTIVLLCDCAPDDRLSQIKSYIDEPPAGFVRVGSPFVMFFTFEAL